MAKKKKRKQKKTGLTGEKASGVERRQRQNQDIAQEARTEEETGTRRIQGTWR